MNISVKMLGVIVLITAVISAAFTRYYFPAIKTETVNVDHDVIHNNIVSVTHTVKEPNGAVDTTITTTDHTSQIDTKTNTVVQAAPKWNVSGLVANDFRSVLKPVYGASVSKEVLGPITIGLWGLSSATVGVSVGVNF